MQVVDVTLVLDYSCFLKLKDPLYGPESRKNLISISS